MGSKEQISPLTFKKKSQGDRIKKASKTSHQQDGGKPGARSKNQSPEVSRTSSEVKQSYKTSSALTKKKEKEAQGSVVKPVDFLNMN